jgi:RNA polymerase sigma factor (sigma-70 family)
MEVPVPFLDPDRSLDENRLINRLRQGDPSALQAVYVAYKDELFTAACFLLDDTSSAEDCLHDVFVTLASTASRIRITSSLKSYLFTCIANRARDMLRRRFRRDTSYGDGIDRPTPNEHPLIKMIREEQSRKLVIALDKLPESQREVIILHLHGGLTFKEIAEHSGQSMNTAQSRYRYGIEHLRNALGGPNL